MSERRPFRLHLKHVAPASEVAARERLELLRDLARDYGLAEETSERILALPDEELLFHLIQRNGAQRSYYRLGETIMLRIVLRALEDAEQEGLVWTPIIDQLAEGYVMSRVNRQRTPAGALRPAPPQLPREAELAEGLVPWIESASDPADLADLLTFRASVVHRLVARHAHVISRPIFERLRDSGYEAQCELAQNENLDVSYRTELANAAWQQYREAVKRKRQTWEMSQATRVLEAVATSCGGLPAHIRREVLNRQRRVASPDRDQVNILLEDRGLGATEAKRMISLLGEKGRARLLVREVCDPATTRKLLADRAVALHMFKDPATEPTWVAALVNAHTGDRFMLAEAARHPNLPIDSVRRMITAAGEWPDLQVRLLRRSGTLEDVSARMLLMATGHAMVAEALLPHATAQEYPALIDLVATASATRAVNVIEETPPPAGAVVAPHTVAKLLQCEDTEARMRAIGLLGRTDARRTLSRA